jgi:hypothetical protein
MSTNRLWKNFTGRRCEQEALQQRFLAQPDGQHGLGPCAAFAAQFFISLLISAPIRGIRGKNINSRLFAFIRG